MREIQVTMSKLRQNLGSLVSRAAYGKERIILIAHGEAKAAIISVEDLQRLRALNDDRSAHDRFEATLAKADLLRERIQQWQEAHGIKSEDTVDTLNELRAQHDDELNGLR
jgi:prevent-host-death family protein